MRFLRSVLLIIFASSLALRADPSPILPDQALTPGATFDVTAEQLSVPGYCKKVRNVPQSVKEQVYAEYGITHRAPGEYEVDHLISLELGGNNSIQNLWPESFLTEPWNAHVKDQLENRLHELVVSGKVDLKTAQREIASDWIAAYKKYISREPPNGKHLRINPEELSNTPNSFSPSDHRESPQEKVTPKQSNPSESQTDQEVWVNTNSGVIWRAGTTYYGKTKHGEYMSESEALSKGYHLPRE